MELLEKYREELMKSKKYSDDTIHSYCSDVKKFLNSIGKDVSVVTAEDVEIFLREDAPATATRRFSSIKNFYKYLNKKGVTDNYPIVRGETYNSLRKIPKRMSMHMTIAEANRFMAEAAKKIKNYAMMMVFINTGMRESELCNLERANYDGELIKYIAKGDKERIVPVGSQTAKAIDEYLLTRKDDLKYLFVSNWGRQYSVSGIYTLVKAITDRAGVKKNITPHKLRHTCAAAMRANGANVYDIAKKLGHEDIKVTEEYLRTLIDERDIEVAEKGSFNVDFRAQAEA